MEIKALDLTENQKINLLSPENRGIYDRPGSVCFGLLDSNKIKAIALLSLPDNGGKFYILNHFALVDSDNEMELYELLLYVEKLLISKNSSVLVAKLMKEEDELYKCAKILKNCKYKLINVDGNFLMYYFQDIFDTLFYDKLHGEKIKKKTCFFNQLTLQQQEELAERRGSLSDINRKYTFCYLDHGHVTGLVNIKEFHDIFIRIEDIWIDKSENATVFLMTILENIMDIGEKMKEDAMVIFDMENISIIEKIRTVWGEPEVDYRIFEFIKFLK